MRLHPMRFLVRYFLRGLAIVVPLGITFYVVYVLFAWIDNLMPFSFPGPGFLVALALTTLIGYLASNFVTRRLFDGIEEVLERVPFISTIYRSIKDITDAVVGDRSRFQRPVRVRFSDDAQASMIGFVTQESVRFDSAEPHVAVYLPWSYNMGGHLVIVPADRVEPLSISSGRVMTFVMSGGLAKGGSAGDPLARPGPSTDAEAEEPLGKSG